MIKNVLKKENIMLNVSVSSKEEAIRTAGELLLKNNYVDKIYIDKMLERDNLSTTYMGNFIAIPHGTESAKQNVLNSGISIVQIPNGVDFGNRSIVKIVFGIAGKDNEHLDILSQIAIVCSEEENVNKIITSGSQEEIIRMFYSS